MTYMWTSNAYEAGNSEIDLKNVPLSKVTIEVKEENKALIESLRKDLAEVTRKAREVEDAKRYWLKRYEDARNSARQLGEEVAKLKRDAEGTGSGHRYVRLVKHLADRKGHLERIKADAAREMAWEEGLGAEERLNEVTAALGAAGVR
ncbi:hypothetical protein DWB77_02085 [Streptomyces hundungensis]|uniref:Uncharacterized protein n=1 Tax=Streptomyces hundungensis TaxID=1077946 RepID=A0A387H808_9ACTN|nr:hypothetical protein [Streptomyces hundungensis]AYG79966.1 hypothetical protein DWB77_02085 [Streptomyces hundungensis]